MTASRLMLGAFVASIGLFGGATVRAVAIPVPNANFDTLYKPGSTTITASLPGGGYTIGTGAGVTVIGGLASYSDSTFGGTVDVPGWTGGAPTGIQDFPPAAGQFPAGTDTLPYGIYVQGPSFGGNPNQLVTSAASLGNVAAGTSYTLTIRVGWRNDVSPPASPILLDLNASGSPITPDVSSSPARVQGGFVTYSRTYNATSLTGLLGDPLTISFGTGASPSGQQVEFDTVTLIATPEPASLSLLGMGSVSLLARRRRA